MVRPLQQDIRTSTNLRTLNSQTRLTPVYVPADREHGNAPPAYAPPQTQPSPVAITAEDVKLELRTLIDEDGLIVTVEPPLAPKNEKLAHVPCDIVLVIDVSGSMSSEARIPGSSDQESTGLSVLDLVKHACRTILSTLDERDRLAIITFSNNATEIQELTIMDDENKKVAEDNIEKMHVQGATNLWAGLRKGLECARRQAQTNRIPAVMLLTDGLPNHMCPPGGYVPALKEMGIIIPTIHTFGFGFQLRSGLLKSIAEFGRGNYSFIPDTGMIGTVFVHAVAHLQSTYAINAVLNLVYPDNITIEQTSGSSVDQQKPEHMVESRRYHLKIPLGNIQYGQSRDILLRRKYDVQVQQQDDMENIHAAIEYHLGSENRFTPHTRRYNGSSSPFTPSEDAYHVSRHMVLAFLASLFPIDPLGEHRTCIPVTSGLNHTSYIKVKGQDRGKNQGSSQAESERDHREEISISDPLMQKQAELRDLVANLPAAKFPEDLQCASLMQDLIHPEPFGQISLALSNQDYFERWGQHYLPSIHGAHARQLCNSFKDPGPLQYGLKSPLFIKCRTALNKAFDDLPPPSPSILPVVHQQRSRKMRRMHSMATDLTDSSDTEVDGGDLLRSQAYASTSDGRKLRPITSMRDWNNPSGPCFAGRTPVLLSSGVNVPISSLRGGMSVFTPVGSKRVAAVVITPVQRASMVNLEGVLVTPWHPVAVPGQTSGSDEHDGWVFPCRASRDRAEYTGFIYSILLQKDNNVDAHAIMLGGGPTGVPFWGVTLGHGVLTGADVRAHNFFGDYRRVVRNLKRLRPMSDGRVATGGVKRSMKSGLVYGFTKVNARMGPAQGSEVFTTIHASRSFH